MKRRTVNPYKGFPRTRVRKDRDGQEVHQIRDRALTPLRAKWADGLGTLSTLGTAATGFASIDPGTGEPADFIVVLFGALITAPLQRLGFRRLLKRSHTIRISADYISVLTWRGWRHFDRSVAMSFELPVHRKAEQEQIENTIKDKQAAQNGKVHRPERYYAKSCQLVLIYGGSRHVLMDIYDPDKASAILGRINECSRGQGITRTPRDEWGQSTGSLSGPERKDQRQLPGPAAGDLPALEFNDTLSHAKGGEYK